MTANDIASELRRLSGGGLITAREVGMFVRDKNITRVRNEYLSNLDSCRGKYLVTDVAREIKRKMR